MVEQSGERGALEGAQHDQGGEVRRERQGEGEGGGGQGGGRHHGGAAVAVGERARGEQAEGEAEGGGGGRPAGLPGGEAEVVGEDRQQALGGVEEDEGRDAGREQGEVGPAEGALAGAVPVVREQGASGKRRPSARGLSGWRVGWARASEVATDAPVLEGCMTSKVELSY